MQKDIHPTYYRQSTITCACGTVFKTGSTVETMQTEVCSQCHPFYTGKKKFVDTTGRVDRFKKLSERAAEAKTAHVAAQERRAKKAAKEKKEGKAVRAEVVGKHTITTKKPAKKAAKQAV